MLSHSAHDHRHDDEEKKDLFGPVADLMVGIVFIFLMLMVTLSLNQRNEDSLNQQNEDFPKEIQALKKKK